MHLISCKNNFFLYIFIFIQTNATVMCAVSSLFFLHELFYVKYSYKETIVQLQKFVISKFIVRTILSFVKM